MDAASILGVTKGEGGGGARKGREPAAPKPKGVSREVWQITAGYVPDGGGGAGSKDGPAPLVQSVGFKGRRKGVGAARKVAWAWRPFTSSARKDGLALSHWVKAREARRRDPLLLRHRSSFTRLF